MSLADFGYDPDDPARGRDLPDKLIRAIGDAPILNQIPKTRNAVTRPDPNSHELDVLRCLSHGMTPGMAGETLGRSEWTIRDQIRAARYKLKAKTKTQACCEAIRRGLIP